MFCKNKLVVLHPFGVRVVIFLLETFSLFFTTRFLEPRKKVNTTNERKNVKRKKGMHYKWTKKIWKKFQRNKKNYNKEIKLLLNELRPRCSICFLLWNYKLFRKIILDNLWSVIKTDTNGIFQKLKIIVFMRIEQVTNKTKVSITWLSFSQMYFF